MSNAVLQMQDAGFSREQVEAVTAYLDSGAATKADISEVKGVLTLLKWMVGVAITVGLANLYLIIRLADAAG